MDQNLAERPMTEDMLPEDDEAPDAVPVPGSLVPHLNETAVLLDIDGTLLDLARRRAKVWVPPGLAKTLRRLHQRTDGALALVSGVRSMISILFLRRISFRHRRPWSEMRIEADSEAVAAMRRRWTRS